MTPDFDNILEGLNQVGVEERYQKLSVGHWPGLDWCVCVCDGDDNNLENSSI